MVQMQPWSLQQATLRDYLEWLLHHRPLAANNHFSTMISEVTDHEMLLFTSVFIFFFRSRHMFYSEFLFPFFKLLVQLGLKYVVSFI